MRPLSHFCYYKSMDATRRAQVRYKEQDCVLGSTGAPKQGCVSKSSGALIKAGMRFRAHRCVWKSGAALVSAVVRFRRTAASRIAPVRLE